MAPFSKRSLQSMIIAFVITSLSSLFLISGFTNPDSPAMFSVPDLCDGTPVSKTTVCERVTIVRLDDKDLDRRAYFDKLMFSIREPTKEQKILAPYHPSK
jgi:hypothetical protein